MREDDVLKSLPDEDRLSREGSNWRTDEKEKDERDGQAINCYRVGRDY